ncbi:MAG: M28 family metallopeptidase [Planctomycetota bacterium]
MSNADRQQVEANLRRHVDRLAGLIGQRKLSKPGSIEATLGLIRSEWEGQGYEVGEETYQALDDTATNLIVEVPGGKKSDEIILLGAHYDTALETPGADDNASAVAVLLEVSRLLRGHRGKRTARYVAFACEEAPYFNLGAMGSQHNARQCRERGDDIRAMLCLEMVGYFRDEPGSQKRPATLPRWTHPFFPSRGNFLAAVGNLRSWRLLWPMRRGFKRATRLPLLSIALPEAIHEIRRSDNSSYWDQGYPALMLTDTSFLRNPHYHLPTDTPETLDYERMTEVALGVAGAMRRLLK